MKTLIVAVALSALIASPILAASASSEGKAHATRQAAKHAKSAKHAKPMRAVRRAREQPPEAFSRFVHRPEYDVYVNGSYAGSDPDPLVRMQIKREYECSDTFHGC